MICPSIPSRLTLCIIAVGLVFGSQAALATDPPINAQSIAVGEAKLYVSSGFGYRNTNNKFLDDDNKVDNPGFYLSPELLLKADSGTLNFETLYKGEFATFDDSDYDVNDHLLLVSSDAEFTRRLRAMANFQVKRSHDEITVAGSQVSLGTSATVATAISATTGVTYGATAAKGNLGAQLYVLDYDGNDSDDQASAIEDSYTLIEPSVDFSLRVSEDTRATFDLSHGVYNYGKTGLDRNITTFLAGAEFAASGKLAGRIKLGVAHTSYDAADVNAHTDFVTMTQLLYTIADHNRLSLRVERQLDNRDGTTVNFTSANTIADIVDFNWRYTWSSRLSHMASLNWRSVNRRCPLIPYAATSLGLSFNYLILPWLSAEAGLRSDTRQGDSCTAGISSTDLDYSRIVTIVGLRAVL